MQKIVDITLELLTPADNGYGEACEVTRQLFLREIGVELQSFESHIIAAYQEQRPVGTIGLSVASEGPLLGELTVAPRDLLRELNLKREELGQVGQIAIERGQRPDLVHFLCRSISAYALSRHLSDVLIFIPRYVRRSIAQANVNLMTLDDAPDIRNPALGLSEEQIVMWEEKYFRLDPGLYAVNLQQAVAAYDLFLHSKQPVRYGPRLADILNEPEI